MRHVLTSRLILLPTYCSYRSEFDHPSAILVAMFVQIYHVAGGGQTTRTIHGIQVVMMMFPGTNLRLRCSPIHRWAIPPFTPAEDGFTPWRSCAFPAPTYLQVARPRPAESDHLPTHRWAGPLMTTDEYEQRKKFKVVIKARTHDI